MIVYDIRDLVKCYPGQTQPANNRISLQVQQGEIFGILGENGAGKSTLVRQMVNLVPSTSGAITLFGQDIRRDPLHVPMHVGYMPQDGRALNSLTVGEALFFTAHLRGLSRAAAIEERDSLLERWQLVPLRNRYSGRLSGGQLRLLQLAVAMAGSPPVLILDEPTSNLDPQRRKLVWDNLRRLNDEQGTTIMFITHDALEAEKVIQRVAIVHEGELVALGQPSQLKRTIDRRVRLELFFPPETPPTVPVDAPCYRRGPGRWVLLLEPQDVSTVLQRLDMSRIDDLRLYSATLEDLYFHYAKSA